MNLIKNAIDRTIAKTHDKKSYSNCNIAKYVGYSEATISKLVNGMQTPSPDVIVSISAYLHDPILKEEYCAQMCPIGKCKHPNGYIPQDLLTTGYMMPSVIQSQSDYMNTLHKALADGKLSRSEVLRLKEFTAQFWENIAIQTDIANMIENLNVGDFSEQKIIHDTARSSKCIQQ